MPALKDIRSSMPDMIAAMAIAGLLLPEAVAYSRIGHLPPQAGVIALFAGLFLYPVAGLSRFAIVSATSSSAAVMAAAIAGLSSGDDSLRLTLSAGLVLVTGVFFVLASIARLGEITAYIAKPVLRGFTFGLALVIISRQVAEMVHLQPVHQDLLRYCAFLLLHIQQWNWPGLLLGMGSWLLLVLLARIPYFPASLLVIVLGILLGHYVSWSAWHIGVVGSLNMGAVHPGIPELSQSQWLRLMELGFAMVMILYAESYGSIRSFAMKYGDKFAPNRDLLALGLANICSGFFQGMPVGAGYSGTSANETAGAVSRRAGAMAGVVLALMVWAFRPALAQTPNPVLAAIVIHVLGHTLNPGVFRPYFRLHRDRSVIVAAVVAVVTLGVLDGLLAAMAFSLLVTLRRFSEPSLFQLGRLAQGHDFVAVDSHPQAQQVPGLLILRPGEPLFFANVEKVLLAAQEWAIRSKEHIHTLILSLEESPDLDSTSIEALYELYVLLQRQGLQLVLSRVKERALMGLQRLSPALPAANLSIFSVDETVQELLNVQESHAETQKLLPTDGNSPV